MLANIFRYLSNWCYWALQICMRFTLSSRCHVTITCTYSGTCTAIVTSLNVNALWSITVNTATALEMFPLYIILYCCDVIDCTAARVFTAQRSAQELPAVERQDLDQCSVLGGQQMVLTGQNFTSDSKVIFSEKTQGEEYSLIVNV